MFRVAFQHPQVSPWISRLGRIPRWGWIAIGVGVVLPIVVLLVSLTLVALLTGLAVFAVVAALLALRGLWLRLKHGFKHDGRRNVRIVVRRVNSEFYP